MRADPLIQGTKAVLQRVMPKRKVFSHIGIRHSPSIDRLFSLSRTSMRQPFTVMLSVVRENVPPVTTNCLGVTVATGECHLGGSQHRTSAFSSFCGSFGLGSNLAVARHMDENMHISRGIDYSRRLFRRAPDVFNRSRRLAGNRVVRTARQLLKFPRFHSKLRNKFLSASI